MKTISPLQYDWLCAVERENNEAVARIAKELPSGELFERGLYTCIPHPENPSGMVHGSARITQAGRDALMCYRAIIGVL